MTGELILLVQWLLMIEVIGWLFLPLTNWWGRDLFWRGAAISRFIGTLTIGLVAWQLAYLGIVPLERTFLLIIGLALGSLGWFYFSPRSNQTHQWLLASTTFWLPFFIMLIIRGFNPHINVFEKFMDMALINGLVRIQWLPAQDVWFAGQPVNYYYFGHFLSALLIKLSGVPSSIGYNFMVATFAGWISSLTFTFTATFLWNKTKKLATTIKSGVLGILLLIAAGTPFTFSFLFKEKENAYWYWSSIRLIPGTIHEIPSYSLFVADLHSHLLSIPNNIFLLLNLLTIALLWQKKKTIKNTELWWRCGLQGILIGVSLITSAWDVPMYLGLSLLLLIIFIGQQPLPLLQRVTTLCISGSCLLTSFVLTSLPFLLHFDHSIAGGVGLVSSHTALSHFLTLWGIPLFIFAGGYWWFSLPKKTTSGNHLTALFKTFLLSFGLWAIFLLLIPEVVYLKDIYGSDFYRGNTVFKFYYQAFIILSLVSSVFISWVSTHTPRTTYTRVWLITALIGIGVCLVYPLQIVPAYYENFAHWYGWDGMSYLNRDNSSDAAAITWLQKNISGQPVVLEAAGESYSGDNRVSVFTGLPTVQGWLVHEWLWRGSYEKPSQRTEEVAQFYETTDSAVRHQFINKYQIEYVYIGDLENQKYPTLDLAGLTKLGTVVYKNEGVHIVKVSR